ncbi:hypothetical protein I553_4064 [Mycobacterium xenopi 4042]|uniref:Uncharacterized protein n=1 Tax=Mycobacterium xenopi 4042 TaxID=1299334 RepID=X7Z1Y9_MYCXE|nr:hypothetical protein I553_4064 [Mycobacterium xenopi 4042]
MAPVLAICGVDAGNEGGRPCRKRQPRSLRPTRAPFIQFLRYLSFGGCSSGCRSGRSSSISVCPVPAGFQPMLIAAAAAVAAVAAASRWTRGGVIAALLAIALRGAVAVLVGPSWEPDQLVPLYLGPAVVVELRPHTDFRRPLLFGAVAV